MLNRIVTIIGLILLVLSFPILYFTTLNAGVNSFVVLAVDYEICTSTDDCSDAEREILAQFIIERTNYSSLQQIQWCLGVDSWADTSVRRGGWLIGTMMDVGYLFCPRAL